MVYCNISYFNELLFICLFIYFGTVLYIQCLCYLCSKKACCVCSLYVVMFAVFPDVQGTLLLNFKMDACREKSLYCTVQNVELFSCSLASEQSTALSILEPVTINIELIPPDVWRGVRSIEESAKMVPDSHILKVIVTCMHSPCPIHAHT